MIRSILYATDLGLYSPYVLQHALSLARSFGAQLHVVHAVEPLSLFAESVLQTYVEETRLRELREKGMQVVLESIRQRVLESFREEMQDAGQDMQLIASLQVVQGEGSFIDAFHIGFHIDTRNLLNASILRHH